MKQIRPSPGGLLVDEALRMIDSYGWRLGQALWNCAPGEFRKTEPPDCWYDNMQVPAFLKAYKEWYEQN